MNIAALLWTCTMCYTTQRTMSYGARRIKFWSSFTVADAITTELLEKQKHHSGLAMDHQCIVQRLCTFSAKGGYVFGSVGLFVCLYVCHG